MSCVNFMGDSELNAAHLSKLEDSKSDLSSPALTPPAPASRRPTSLCACPASTGVPSMSQCAFWHFKSRDRIGSCGSVKQPPCTESEILQIIKDGTEGTSSRDALEQCLTKTGKSGATMYYWAAARCYNFGSVVFPLKLAQSGSTRFCLGCCKPFS